MSVLDVDFAGEGATGTVTREPKSAQDTYTIRNENKRSDQVKEQDIIREVPDVDRDYRERQLRAERDAGRAPAHQATDTRWDPAAARDPNA